MTEIKCPQCGKETIQEKGEWNNNIIICSKCNCEFYVEREEIVTYEYEVTETQRSKAIRQMKEILEADWKKTLNDEKEFQKTKKMYLDIAQEYKCYELVNEIEAGNFPSIFARFVNIFLKK